MGDSAQFGARGHAYSSGLCVGLPESRPAGMVRHPGLKGFHPPLPLQRQRLDFFNHKKQNMPVLFPLKSSVHTDT